SGALQVEQANAWSNLTQPIFQINQNGYIYVYSCNTSEMTVRTDNLFIAHYQGSLLEEFHYYPFGMCFDVSKSPTLGKSAAIKYNSQLHEHDEFEDANGNVYGLEDYNFAFRNYDAQIGRWLQPDPLMQHPSPYLAMSNNPVSFTDPTGLWDDIRKINTTGDLYIDGQRVFWFDSETNSWIAEEAVIHAVDGGNHYPKYTGTFNQFGFPVVAGTAYGEKAANYQNNQLAWGMSLKEDNISISRAIWNLFITGYPNGKIPENIVSFSLANNPLNWLMGGSSFKSLIKAANSGGRAFFSGVGSEVRAINKGYQTLGQTRAGKNLQNLIESKNIPWSQAEPMWQRLSAAWARGVPNGSTVNVFLNNPRAESIWFKTELPILLSKGVKINYR
ncbi:MAG: hypothetical protein MH472_14410, partial [Bacteroidia bacterium]|nr:hypothetical protein [Bacteroidia bacterium]